MSCVSEGIAADMRGIRWTYAFRPGTELGMDDARCMTMAIDNPAVIVTPRLLFAICLRALDDGVP